MNIRESINETLRKNFNEAHLIETQAVQVYVKKAGEILKAIDEIDLLKKDEDGNFVNRGQLITLMLIWKEQQAMIGKLAQTDAAREYALYCRKMNAKVKQMKDHGVIEEGEVTFMDDDVQFYSPLKLKNAKPDGKTE